jgi:hypothetical protein
LLGFSLFGDHACATLLSSIPLTLIQLSIQNNKITNQLAEIPASKGNKISLTSINKTIEI